MPIATIRRSLTGAARLFVGRADGLALLDRTVDGFWRSFLVIALLIPLDMVTLLALSRIEGEAFDGFHASHFVVLALDWVMFPALLALAAGPLGVSANYVNYVVARNWSAPIVAAILMVPIVLQGAGWVPDIGGTLLSIVAVIAVLRYHYVILRIALQATAGLAVALVICDLLLTVLILRVLG